jgi:hypothetical protein
VSTNVRLKLSCLKLLAEERVTQLVQMLVQILMICCAHAVQVILLIHSWIIMYHVGLAAMRWQIIRAEKANFQYRIFVLR